MLCVVMLLCFAINSASAARDCRDVSGTYNYEEETLFDEDTNYYAQTLVDGSNFIVTLSASHDGFLGFGIPEQSSGSMLGADIVVAGFEDGGVRIRDYYVLHEAFPFSPFGGSVQRNEDSEPVSTIGSALYPRQDCDNGGTDGKLK